MFFAVVEVVLSYKTTSQDRIVLCYVFFAFRIRSIRKQHEFIRMMDIMIKRHPGIYEGGEGCKAVSGLQKTKLRGKYDLAKQVI